MAARPGRRGRGDPLLVSPIPTIVLEEWEASMMRRFRKHKARYGVESPEAQAEISEAAVSPPLAEAVGVLTAASSTVRGCKIEPARPFLQALRDRLGWTPGWDDTRPSEALARAKIRCKLDVLRAYRQPEEYLSSPDAGRVAMYDFLCDDIFGMPMRSVGRPRREPHGLSCGIPAQPIPVRDSASVPAAACPPVPAAGAALGSLVLPPPGGSAGSPHRRRDRPRPPA
mmetsp:Transcript_95655/g.295145  ORF Transcript_95655/g.295145 Transcript_95655/m.295145 type:complete len:227 (-) Transcript_95655:350-1030(-)